MTRTLLLLLLIGCSSAPADKVLVETGAHCDPIAMIGKYGVYRCEDNKHDVDCYAYMYGISCVPRTHTTTLTFSPTGTSLGNERRGELPQFDTRSTIPSVERTVTISVPTRTPCPSLGKDDK